MNTTLRCFERVIEQRGLRLTRQRRLILRVLTSIDTFASADMVFRQLQRQGYSIGSVTVHRTLQVFVRCGIATARVFDDAVTRYALVNVRSAAAGKSCHLVCTRCGEVVTIVEGTSIAPLRAIAATHGFEIASIRRELLGHCRDCRRTLSAQTTNGSATMKPTPLQDLVEQDGEGLSQLRVSRFGDDLEDGARIVPVALSR